ncbi:MAG: hypothetical protein KAG97_12910 [Victivallales bacterium]|nr:hypothetical protein [Victivallales bacterium]
MNVDNPYLRNYFENMLLEVVRSLNNGRLPFMMTPEGEPLAIAPDGRSVTIFKISSRIRF